MKANRAILLAALKWGGALCVLLANWAARADSIVVPAENRSTPGTSGLSVPFRDTDRRWQQFYVSSQFDEAAGDLLRISELRYRMDERSTASAFSTIARGLTISMSTTA
jgi:hypothetical protein